MRAGADVHAREPKSLITPLHAAVSLECGGGAEALLDGGANVNERDRYGHTPLHLASSCHRGADVVAC